MPAKTFNISKVNIPEASALLSGGSSNLTSKPASALEFLGVGRLWLSQLARQLCLSSCRIPTPREPQQSVQGGIAMQ